MLEIKVYDDYKLWETNAFTFNEGITCLIGRNGAGKTTFLKEAREVLKNDKTKAFYYDNVDSEKFANDKLLNFTGDIARLCRNISGSEGQNIQFNFEDKVESIGRYIKTCKESNQNKAVILLDGLDSGISLDYAIKLKGELFSLIISDCKKRKMEPYIILSANNYEFCNGEDCINIKNAEHIRFNSYEEFRKFYIKEEM